ncbi:hypothetical protein D3C75_1165850 [compost metagenome]
MTRCHIGQERWRREGRQLARATCVSGAHRLCDGAEAADARCDDGGGARAFSWMLGMPAGLLQCFIRCYQRKLDEPIHLLAFLGVDDPLGLIACHGILGQCGHAAAH